MVWDTEEEFRALYEEHRDHIYNYLLKLTADQDLAEDLTQDAFIKIHKYRDRFDASRGKFSSWAVQIAHNTFLNNYNKTKKSGEDQVYDEVMEHTLPSDEDPVGDIEQNILLNEIKNAILSLPEPERTVLYNKEIKKKSLNETAEELGLTVRTISRRLLSAYEMVRVELERRQITLN